MFAINEELAYFCGARQLESVQAKPQILAWITCDGVHIDPGSGKHTLLGIFSNIRARHFPVTHPRMMWFLTLTELAAGKHQLRILFGYGIGEPKVVVAREFESKSPVQQIGRASVRERAYSPD